MIFSFHKTPENGQIWAHCVSTAKLNFVIKVSLISTSHNEWITQRNFCDKICYKTIRVKLLEFGLWYVTLGTLYKQALCWSHGFILSVSYEWCASHCKASFCKIFEVIWKNIHHMIHMKNNNSTSFVFLSSKQIQEQSVLFLYINWPPRVP